MQPGFISQYFDGVAMKRLRAVEANPQSSHQHELNGISPLRQILGDKRLTNYPARFVWLGGENEGIRDDSTITWYDSRENIRNRPAEYRMYFKHNVVMDMASEGDLLIVAKRPNEGLYCFVAPAGSTVELQLMWLFDTPQVGFGVEYNDLSEQHDLKVDFVVRHILEELGVEAQDSTALLLDSFLEPYIHEGAFPKTKEFSALARRVAPSIVGDVSPQDDPDAALLIWIDLEERLFKRLERHLVSMRLEKGFYAGREMDVDGFIKYSLSVHNRRKSRMGYALENHLQEIFLANNLRYSLKPETEHGSEPDFLFPGVSEYWDADFPSERLSMLGAKSTCKDRWRQVLAEANRIRNKHLLTLEPAISEKQTEEMRARSLQLVLPTRLHETYQATQRKSLMNLNQFLEMVLAKQNQA